MFQDQLRGQELQQVAFGHPTDPIGALGAAAPPTACSKMSEESDSDDRSGRKPQMQGRFSGRLLKKEDERKLSDECRLVGPLLGGVRGHGDKTRSTLAKIVRGIANGAVRRFCEEREAMLQQMYTQLQKDASLRQQLADAQLSVALLQVDAAVKTRRLHELGYGPGSYAEEIARAQEAVRAQHAAAQAAAAQATAAQAAAVQQHVQRQLQAAPQVHPGLWYPAAAPLHAPLQSQVGASSLHSGLLQPQLVGGAGIHGLSGSLPSLQSGGLGPASSAPGLLMPTAGASRLYGSQAVGPLQPLAPSPKLQAVPAGLAAPALPATSQAPVVALPQASYQPSAAAPAPSAAGQAGMGSRPGGSLLLHQLQQSAQASSQAATQSTAFPSQVGPYAPAGSGLGSSAAWATVTGAASAGLVAQQQQQQQQQQPAAATGSAGTQPSLSQMAHPPAVVTTGAAGAPAATGSREGYVKTESQQGAGFQSGRQPTGEEAATSTASANSQQGAAKRPRLELGGVQAVQGSTANQAPVGQAFQPAPGLHLQQPMGQQQQQQAPTGAQQQVSTLAPVHPAQLLNPPPLPGGMQQLDLQQPRQLQQQAQQLQQQEQQQLPANLQLGVTPQGGFFLYLR